MDNLDLSNVTPEQIEKIKAILNEPKTNSVVETEYLDGIKKIKQTKDIPSIELDTKIDLDRDIDQLIPQNLGVKMSEKRMKGLLSNADKETYRQLEIIHEEGVEKFWGRVKKVVESRKVIDKNDIDSDISYLNDELNRNR